METVRDRLWLWGHAAGSHNPGTGPVEWNLPADSSIAPGDAARLLGIPNLLMIRYNGMPLLPYDGLASSLSSLKSIAWGITGAMGETSDEERAHVLDLARRTPNITGLVMDDFINWDTDEPELSLAEIEQISEQRVLPGRTLDLMTILYSHQLAAPIGAHLALCNQVSLWVWHSSDLSALPDALKRLEQRVPGHEIFLGCYLWDLGPRAPMPLDRFQEQCRQGLQWLQEGRVSGLIFLASCYCDLELDTVEWLRAWIDEVGDAPIRG